MKNLIIAILLLASFSVQAEVPVAAVRTQVMHDICTTKTSGIRNVSTATKKEVYRRAGITYGERTLCSKGYEVDHRISLELGGTNDISNLQLQAYCTKEELAPNFPATVLYDARAKDVVENRLHTAICATVITPKAAQEQIYNWKN